MKHGQIIGVTATVPDLAAALTDYRDVLGLREVERGVIDAELARAWGGGEGTAYTALCPTSGADCTLRLVEQALDPGFVPTTTFGWNAFELTVKDVFGWAERVRASGFEVVGPPREIAGLPYFVAMQMLGRGREMIYLNEVRADTPASDLPRATSPVDHVFIVILATPDRAATTAWYRDRLGLDAGGVYTIEYSMINKAFGLPAGTQSTIAMVQHGRMPIVEIDEYPSAATPRRAGAAGLPPGNAVVTLAVSNLPDLDWIAPPVRRTGATYGGRLAGTVRGPSGELLELVAI